MIRGIFFFLIFCIIVLFSAFVAKEKFGINAVEEFNIDKISGALTNDSFKDKKEPKINTEKKEENTLNQKDNGTSVYFVKAEDNESVKVATTKKDTTYKSDSERFRATMEALFSGPSGFEKIAGVYSEIPPETKLLGIKEDKNSYTINISEDFELGGGADSMKVRVKQLVTTATKAAGDKDVYLEIEGKRAEYVGGEGIIILQPLKRNLQ